jgi:hypothetical protein
MYICFQLRTLPFKQLREFTMNCAWYFCKWTFNVELYTDNEPTTLNGYTRGELRHQNSTPLTSQTHHIRAAVPSETTE